MEKPYPTRFDMPVDVKELELPESELYPGNPNNYSWHHYWFTEPAFSANSLYKYLRNLKNNQVLMLNDQHNYGKRALHSIYAPPKPPTFSHAMERVEMAYLLEEPLHYREKGVIGWIERAITADEVADIKKEYNLYNA